MTSRCSNGTTQTSDFRDIEKLFTDAYLRLLPRHCITPRPIPTIKKKCHANVAYTIRVLNRKFWFPLSQISAQFVTVSQVRLLLELPEICLLVPMISLSIYCSAFLINGGLVTSCVGSVS